MMIKIVVANGGEVIGKVEPMFLGFGAEPVGWVAQYESLSGMWVDVDKGRFYGSENDAVQALYEYAKQFA